MATPQKPNDPDGCWGGFNGIIAWCLKKPREGMLTCWWHRSQEFDARQLKAKIQAGEDIRYLGQSRRIRNRNQEDA